MKTAIVWFKTDLQLHDNETLTQSLALIMKFVAFIDNHRLRRDEVNRVCTGGTIVFISH